MIEKSIIFKVTNDSDVDAAYIYMSEDQGAGFLETYTCDDLPKVVVGDINLDFDKNGKLLGIEILNASKILPEHVLSQMKLIG